MLSYRKVSHIDVPITDYLQIIEKLAISKVEKADKLDLNQHETQSVCRALDSYATNEDFNRNLQIYAQEKARYNILRSDPFYQSLVMSKMAPNLIENTIDFTKNYNDCDYEEKNRIQYELDAFKSNYRAVPEWFAKIGYKPIIHY